MDEVHYFSIVMGIAVSFTGLLGIVVKVATDYTKLKTQFEGLEKEVASARVTRTAETTQLTELNTIVRILQTTMTTTMSDVRKDIGVLYEKVNTAMQGTHNNG